MGSSIKETDNEFPGVLTDVTVTDKSKSALLVKYSPIVLVLDKGIALGRLKSKENAANLSSDSNNIMKKLYTFNNYRLINVNTKTKNYQS